jgi:hypothetical protein
MARPKRSLLRPLIVIPAVLVALGVGAWVAYGYSSFDERFRRSRPALDAYAARVTTEGTAMLAAPPRRLGYFTVLKAEPLPHGFLFQSDYGNPFDWTGIAYSTERLDGFVPGPTAGTGTVFTPIDGNWYSVFRQ